MLLVPASSSLFFKGRPGDPRLGELIQQDISNTKAAYTTLFLYGCPDDLGVTANRGRAGAAGGPDGIRAALYKMTPPLTFKGSQTPDIIDGGNIHVTDHIQTNHSAATDAAAFAAQKGWTVIALGGGHDYAAPNILGWCRGREELKTSKTKSRKTKSLTFGLINVDPHLDVRELENGLPHSGTPFRQILESNKILGQHFVEFGARDGRNAHSHFAYCESHKVRVRLFDKLRQKPDMIKAFHTELKYLEAHTDAIALTIDIDSCFELEGVSAAPVIGFSAWELCQFAYLAGQSKKVSFLELAEVAPGLDPTGRSARIAGEILFYFLKGRTTLAKDL